jgi:hypothetical protein
MAAITTRETGTTGVGGVTRKNLPLTNGEIDNNFIALNTDKLEASYTGNTNLVTLGTVTTGTWSATTIATTRGGTGLTSFTSGGAVYATSSSALTTGTLPIASGGTGITTAPTSGTLLIGTSAGGYSSATLTGTANRITVTNSSGGITLSGPQDLASSSNPQFGSLGIGTAASGTAGRIDANAVVATSITETSTVVHKENITPLNNCLEKMLLLNPVSFNWKKEFNDDRRTQVGLIAEEVDQILPDLVSRDKNGTIEGLNYTKLVAYLIESVKELKQEIKQLKGK